MWNTTTGETIDVKPGHAKAASVAKKNIIHVTNNGLEMAIEKDKAVVGYFGEGLNHVHVRGNLFFGGVGTGNVYILRVHGL